MSVDHRPIGMALEAPDRFLFMDTFIADGRLALVSTYYPDMRFDFAEAVVRVDGVRLRSFSDEGMNELEPTRAVFFALDGVAPRARHDVVVRYRGRSLRTLLAPHVRPAARRFTVATLFKHDHGNIETFYRYYRAQGAERFILYYNGDLGAVRHLLPSHPEIEYGAWDYRYWVDGGSGAFGARLVDPAARDNRHHAQTAFMTLVRHRDLADCSFLALVDLDELLAVPGETVRAHVERVDQPSLTARCYWTERRNLEALVPESLWKYKNFRRIFTLRQRLDNRLRQRLGVPLDAPPLREEDLAHLWTNVRSEGDARGKTIYRHDFAGHFGIHRPKAPLATLFSDELLLHHVVNTAKARFAFMHPDARPLDLLRR